MPPLELPPAPEPLAFAAPAQETQDFSTIPSLEGLELPPLPIVPLAPPEPEPVPQPQLSVPPPLVFLSSQMVREAAKSQIQEPPNAAALPWEPLPQVSEEYLASSAARHRDILRQLQEPPLPEVPAPSEESPSGGGIQSAFGATSESPFGATGSFMDRVQMAGGTRRPESSSGGARSLEGGSLAERLAARQKDKDSDGIGVTTPDASFPGLPELEVPSIPPVETPRLEAVPADPLSGLVIPEIPVLPGVLPALDVVPVGEPASLPQVAEAPAELPAVEESALEPEPVEEGDQALGKPLVSLSIEEESPPDHVVRAHEIRDQVQDADVTTAINLYRRAVEEAPDNLVLRTDLADIHMRYGLLDDAVVQYRQIIMRKPQSVSLRHKLIQAQLWNDNYEESAITLLELADLHSENRNFQDALDALQIVLSLDPHNFDARRKLVDRFAAVGQSSLAAHHLRQLAEGALTKGNVEEAINAFQQLMRISDDPALEDRLAQVHESQGNTEEALRLLRGLSNRYHEAQRWEEAANVTERIIALDPDNLDMRRSLIQQYEGLGLHDRVVAQQFDLASYFHGQGNMNEAIELLERVVTARPDYHEARHRLADAYLDVGRIEDATKHTDTLTQHYLATMDHATAIALYVRLVEAMPESTELREKLIKFYEVAEDPHNALEQWLVLADLHSQANRLEDAVNAHRKALELDESRDDLHCRLALLYLDHLNNQAAAMGEFQRVHELNPGHVDA
ncbi:MAG: tetratricopeptide repeat protein, partial [Candidatus Eremiobacterota bacterium]